ncbi:hypothetical protein QBC42DRAFT_256069 [Cladorrhinum samala]|uniref:Uncharacterized protein n=1 Tax=Cladorrhinum samala TaxID=585594 RepID=A0AAV9HD64_9PEZI|nr:hypothetical protein QBC42DRAFT_256069 [Cladorrhinum samala]
MAVADAASKVDDTKAGGWYSKDEGVFSVKVGEAVGSGRGAERVAGLEVARGQVQLPEREGEGGRLHLPKKTRRGRVAVCTVLCRRGGSWKWDMAACDTAHMDASSHAASGLLSRHLSLSLSLSDSALRTAEAEGRPDREARGSPGGGTEYRSMEMMCFPPSCVLLSHGIPAQGKKTQAPDHDRFFPWSRPPIDKVRGASRAQGCQGSSAAHGGALTCCKRLASWVSFCNLLITQGQRHSEFSSINSIIRLGVIAASDVFNWTGGGLAATSAATDCSSLLLLSQEPVPGTGQQGASTSSSRLQAPVSGHAIELSKVGTVRAGKSTQPLELRDAVIFSKHYNQEQLGPANQMQKNALLRLFPKHVPPVTRGSRRFPVKPLSLPQPHSIGLFQPDPTTAEPSQSTVDLTLSGRRYLADSR